MKPHCVNPIIAYVNTKLDDLTLATIIIGLRTSAPINDAENAVFAAFQRYSDQITSYEDLHEYLLPMSDEQLVGVVSNVKGILHEMEFVRMENNDGDQLTAALFPETNYAGFDVIVTDTSTNETIDVQLKATNNAAYVQEWTDKYPDGEILVTEEIAHEMGLPSSGLSNEELTVKVDDFIEAIVNTPINSNVWQYFPHLTLLSVSHTIFGLYQKYRNGEINQDQFKKYAVAMTGVKISRITLLLALLSLPLISQITGTLLIASLILSAIECFESTKALHWRSVSLNTLGQPLNAIAK